jgi:hypothetical protein
MQRRGGAGDDVELIVSQRDWLHGRISFVAR